MRIIIFTEGGTSMGLGHISRCTSLYDEVISRNIDVEFIIHGDAKYTNILQDRKYTIQNWQSTSYLEKTIKNDDYCIVDSYHATREMYDVISKKSKMALYIDDTGRLAYPKGIVVNPSINIEGIVYPENSEINYLLGADYVILRTVFNSVKRESINKKVYNVLITLGGTDIRNLTPVVINEICENYPEISFNIVVGSEFNTEKYSCNSNINILKSLSAEEMKNVIINADMAISAAGQTTYELLFTQTPFIPIKVIENQIYNCSAIEKIAPCVNVLSYDEFDFAEKLKAEFSNFLDYELRQKIFNCYKNTIDGLGCKRIINSILNQSETIRIRNVKKSDVTAVYNLSNEDYVRRHSINKNKIPFEEHIKWFENIIDSQNHIFYVATNEADEFLGQIRFKLEGNSAVVSISLTKSIAGKGYACNLLLESMKKLKAEKTSLLKVIAYVSEENTPSKKLFEKAGFKLSDNTKSLLEYQYNL